MPGRRRVGTNTLYDFEMKTTFPVRLLAVLLLCLAWATSAMAQGINFGLGNQDEGEMRSLSSRLLNLESRSKYFQVYLNMRGGFDERIGGDGEKGSRVALSHLRPEFLGNVGKWGYRVRLNMMTDHSRDKADGANEVVDIARVFYDSGRHWSFSFGRSFLNYGTFEYDWNAIHVLQFYEFQYNQPGAVATSADVGYEIRKQRFTFEVASGGALPTLDGCPKARELYPASNHPLQYSISWRGSLLGDRLKTIWSYTLRDEVKDHKTHLLMLGTSYSFGKFEAQLDYNLSLGKMDYLGLATEDAKRAGLIADDEMATGTNYQQWILDLGYRPTPRWCLFTKLGVNCSSSSDIARLQHYRKTYEYLVAAQYFLDKEQDLRVSLGYFGKTIDYRHGTGLNNQNTNRIELSFLARLKIL